MSGSHGGGVSCELSGLSLINNIFANNLADKGGGIYLYSSTSKPSVIEGNNFYDNNGLISGGALYLNGKGLTVGNSIFWKNNSISGPTAYLASTAEMDISYSDTEGGKSSFYLSSYSTLNWGPGMVNADPLFVDLANDDFHLTYDSPCRNTGDNTAITELFDFEGDPRIWDGTVDMGADEFHPHLYHMGTVTPGGKIQVKVVGNPGVAPVTLALGKGIQDPPQSTPYGNLYLVLPPLQKFNLGSIPSTGVVL